MHTTRSHVFDTIGRDLRQALRFLRRSPAFTIPAVASLALAISVNTTIFSVFNAALLRPLGTSESGDLVRIGRSLRGDQSFRSASNEEYRYLREHATALDDLLGEAVESISLAGADGVQPVSAEVVTSNYFSMLRVRPFLGRTFAADDDEGAAVAVLSHNFWRRHYGGEVGLVGRTLLLANQPFTIIGVAQAGFGGTFPGIDIDLWLPAASAATARVASGRGESFMLIGRLKAGVSEAAARAELELLAQRMARENPESQRDRGFTLARARGLHPLFAQVAKVLLGGLLAIVSVVLLIACANVAGIQLARASARQSELAVRLACGASRTRVIVQLLIESALLAMLGGAGGLALAVWGVRVLNGISMLAGPTGAPVFLNLELDVRVLWFTAAVTMATALVFGLLPALQSSRVELIAALRGSRTTSGRGQSRLQGGIVVLQVMLSFVLLVGAFLLVRSVRNAGTLDVGFDPDQVVVASFDPQRVGYEQARVEAFYAALLERARRLPGVQHAALADYVPMGPRGGSVGLSVPGTAVSHDAAAGEHPFAVAYNRVSDGYFETVQQPLLRGRDFAPRDRAGAAPVVIVNETMARRFWPSTDALGQRVRLAGDSADRVIVGVARDAKYQSFGSAAGPFVVLPASQHYGPHLTLHVRSTARPDDALRAIRHVAQEIDAGLAPDNAETMRARMSFALIPARIALTIIGVAGVIALLLASGGLYGLICYTLERRMKEIGIRVTLGATRPEVFRSIAGGAIRLTVAGVVLGVVIAAVVTRLLAALLYGLGPTDPVSFMGIALLLVVVTLAAALVAARRGLNVDPMIVLRMD